MDRRVFCDKFAARRHLTSDSVLEWKYDVFNGILDVI
jgi:hypothetical protein